MEEEKLNNIEMDYDKNPIVIEDYNYIFGVLYLIVGAIIMIASDVCSINYSDFSWAANKGSYLGIIGMLFLILSMVITIRHVNNRDNSIFNKKSLSFLKKSP